MNEQVIFKSEPMSRKDLHTRCVELGGVTLHEYTTATGERTDHLLIEFLHREKINMGRKYEKN